LSKNAEEYRQMANKYKRNFSKDDREQRKLLFAEAYKMLNEATILEKYIVDSLLNQAQVITATLVGSVNKFIKFRRFSTVFIDEAAQALEPACWIPIGKADRIVLAGDHCQLPPTVKSLEAAKAGLATTLFEKLMSQEHISVMLQTQYRMHEQIMNFSNTQFYKGELLADASVKQHLLADNDAELANPVEFIDTAGCSFDEKVIAEGQSKYNPDEATLLIKHLQQLLEYLHNVHPQVLETPLSVGIISPYKAQVTHLFEQIRQHPDLQDYQQFIQINSIDGFQGQERDVIYISLVRSNEKSQIGFLADTRRMNVALTRARKKLVVIGDSATLGTNPFYKDFLDYIDTINAYRSAWEFQ
jgi:predicted DNA helicase